MKELSKILEGILDAPDAQADEYIEAKYDQQKIQDEFDWIPKIKGDNEIARFEVAALQVIEAILCAADVHHYDEYDMYRASGLIRGLCYWQCVNYIDSLDWEDREYGKFYIDKNWWDGFLNAKEGSGYWRLLSNSSAYNYLLDNDYIWTLRTQEKALYNDTYKKYVKRILDIAKKYDIYIRPLNRSHTFF